MDSHEKKVEVGAEGMKIVEGERERVYLKKGFLRPILFIHTAGFSNSHNYTLHVRRHHCLPGEQEPR